MRRRGFTLVEVMVALVIIAMVFGALTGTMTSLARARDTSKRRHDAFLRADAALRQVRTDIASILRSDDLFDTRLLLFSERTRSPVGDLDRDELLVFNTRLRPAREIDRFNGEGLEYETQYRIEDSDLGPVLWQRRDNFPDKYPRGGGMATPLVEGIIGLSIEAYDESGWHEEWDSDDQGLPLAMSITVAAAGNRGIDDLFDAKMPITRLRTVVPIDRVPPPRDIFEDEEAALRELEVPLPGQGEAPPGEGGDGSAPSPEQLQQMMDEQGIPPDLVGPDGQPVGRPNGRGPGGPGRPPGGPGGPGGPPGGPGGPPGGQPGTGSGRDTGAGGDS